MFYVSVPFHVQVTAHLIKNIDRVRKERIKTEGVAQVKDWKPARMLDEEDKEEE